MHTALAFRNARLLGENERLATRDSLTGLANRRLFDESLQREVARAQRLGTPVSLLVFDVDHFKQVNDTYGHQTGDAVLREVADALVANTKNYDVAARYGGDEFVVLLPGCNRDDAIRVAERVRHGIARAVGEAPVTISAGVATVPDNASRRGAAHGRGRRRALRGQAHRPRPGLELGPQHRGGSAGAVALDRPARTRRLSPDLREVPVRHVCDATAGRSASSQADRRMIRRPGRPIEGSAVHQGSSVTKRIGHVALFVALAVVPVLALNSLATATPTPDGGTDPRPPGLTDAQRSCLAEQGVTLPAPGSQSEAPALTQEQRKEFRKSVKACGLRGPHVAAPPADRRAAPVPGRPGRDPSRPSGDGTRPQVSAEQRDALRQAALACGLPERGHRDRGGNDQV